MVDNLFLQICIQLLPWRRVWVKRLFNASSKSFVSLIFFSQSEGYIVKQRFQIIFEVFLKLK